MGKLHTDLISNGHKAHVNTRKEQHKTDVCIKNTHHDLAKAARSSASADKTEDKEEYKNNRIIDEQPHGLSIRLKEREVKRHA